MKLPAAVVMDSSSKQPPLLELIDLTDTVSRFKNPSEAKDALEKMNGFDIAGRPIRVGLGNDRYNDAQTQNMLARTDEPAQNSRNGNAPRVAPKPVPTKGMNVGKCIVIQNAFNPVE